MTLDRSAARTGSRPRALCVDDEPVTLRLLERLLARMGIEAEAVESATAALARFDERPPDLVVTDIRMPGMDGHAFIAAIRERDAHVPIIVATGQATLDSAIRALREGASGMLVKPFTVSELAAEVNSTLERTRIRHEALEYRFITPILDGVALALTAAIDARHLETGEHCRELGRLGEALAARFDLDERDRTTIRIGGYLHDVGKIAIADRILLKPGPLTDEELALMREHAALGAAIVETHEAMGPIASIVRHHHERWDGTGYPAGLAGAAIPLGARIIAACDAFSAMTRDRVYRQKVGPDEAWAEIVARTGHQFDPAVVEAFEVVLGRTRDDGSATDAPVPAAADAILPSRP